MKGPTAFPEKNVFENAKAVKESRKIRSFDCNSVCAHVMIAAVTGIMFPVFRAEGFIRQHGVRRFRGFVGRRFIRFRCRQATEQTFCLSLQILWRLHESGRNMARSDFGGMSGGCRATCPISFVDTLVQGSAYRCASAGAGRWRICRADAPVSARATDLSFPVLGAI